MSAICGVVGADGRPFAARDVAGLMCALRPLGRDAEGTWAGSVGRVGVALGVCEEARSGAPSSLDQPVRSADGALCLVADAALDCPAELAASLQMPARGFISDAQLILAAYARWGEGCLDHLSGEFAFAVADARRGGRGSITRGRVWGDRSRYPLQRLPRAIGATGFEPATARPPAECATRLRHAPKRATGLEPALRAWKALVQPLHHTRVPSSLGPALSPGPQRREKLPR